MILVPAAEKLEMEADFTRVIFGLWMAGTITVEEAATNVHDGEMAKTVPMFLIQPLSTSAWVVV